MRSADDIVRDIAALGGEVVEAAVVFGLAGTERIAGAALELTRRGTGRRLPLPMRRSSLEMVHRGSPIVARAARNLSSVSLLVAGRVVVRVTRPLALALRRSPLGR